MTRSPPRRTKKQKRIRIAIAVGFAAAIVGASAAGCGSSNGVVGGACASGYTRCDLACFDLATDPTNCGACGKACPPAVACTGGVCASVPLDATANDDGNPDFDSSDRVVDGESCDVNDPAHPVCGPAFDSASDAPADSDAGDDGAPESSTGDGSPGTDGSAGDGSTRDAAPADGCAPPFNTPANCGACGQACSPPNNLCSLEDGGYACVPACTAPLVECEGHCVNLARDPTNCGACGKTCPSQYCSLATCQGSVAGNVIVIGHDFAATKTTDQQAKLLTNSVFYSPPSVRLLSFEHYVSVTAVTNAKSILTKFATASGYSLTMTATSDDTFISKGGLTVSNEDVVLIWDQPNAPAGLLGQLGSEWAPNLSAFAQGGGFVIVLDAAQGRGEMPAFETNAALLAVTSHTPVASGTPGDVPLAGLSIARGMTSVYGVDANTASFTTSEPTTTKTLYVANVQGSPTQLLAVHKIIK